MTLTPAQTIALSAFRRSNYAGHIKALLEQELVKQRAAYADDDVTSAVVARLGARDVRGAIEVLFEKEL